MNKEQAIEVLKKVAFLAQKAGALSLEDAATVLVAIQAVDKKEEPEKKEKK
jgi:hypothetical protein